MYSKIHLENCEMKTKVKKKNNDDDLHDTLHTVDVKMIKNTQLEHKTLIEI